MDRISIVNNPSINMAEREEAAFEVNLAKAVRKYPSLYEKTSKVFKDANVKNLAWGKVAIELKLESGKVIILSNFA